MPRSRQIALVVLGLLTIIFGIVAIYVASQISQEDTAPSDSSAGIAESCAWCAGRDQCFQLTGHGPVSGDTPVCNGGPCCEGYVPAQPDAPPPPPDPNLVCPGGAVGKGCLTFICPNGCGTDGKCEGDDVGVQIFTERGSCGATLGGRCGQVDVVNDPRVDSPNPGFLCVKNNLNSCNQARCKWECGDGIKDYNEECDDGNNNNEDSCRNNCTTNNVNPPSECGGSCSSSSDCTNGHTCDGGVCVLTGCLANPEICTSDLCGPNTPQCGGSCYQAPLDDGSTWHSCPTGHECVGDADNGDGTFTLGTCVLDECVADPSQCEADQCRLVGDLCGDGKVDPGEECDDGNNIDGDGCDSDCSSTSSGGSTTSLSGQVYCQDDGDIAYPIDGAVVELELRDEPSSPAALRAVFSNSTGNFAFSGLPENLIHELSVTLPNDTLSNGQPLGQLIGPLAVNCNNSSATGCTGVTGNSYCANGDREYEACTLPAGNFSNFDFRFTNCDLGETGCISLTEIGPDPIDAGPSVVVYSLQYRTYQETDPFPGIQLRVGPDGSSVGRDYYADTNTLVSPSPISNNPSYNENTGIWTYLFTWQATEVGGADTADGTYDVRVILPGDIEIDAASCINDITVANGTTEEPVFVVVKQGSESCTSEGAASINYTVTATNVGPISGVIDYVEDTYDPNLQTYGITPTNINPSFGVDNGSTIRWEGTVADRTFTSGETKTYSYSVLIPSNILFRFAASGVVNDAEVQYTTGSANTVTFSLNTPIVCTIPEIPDTAIFDENSSYLLIGIFMIVAGIFVYKVGFGSSTIQVLINKGIESATEMVMPFEERTEKELQKRFRRNKK